MTYQIATIFVLIVLSVIGFVGIQKSKNYENVWGSMFIYGVGATILMVIGTAVFGFIH